MGSETTYNTSQAPFCFEKSNASHTDGAIENAGGTKILAGQSTNTTAVGEDSIYDYLEDETRIITQLTGLENTDSSSDPTGLEIASFRAVLGTDYDFLDNPGGLMLDFEGY